MEQQCPSRLCVVQQRNPRGECHDPPKFLQMSLHELNTAQRCAQNCDALEREANAIPAKPQLFDLLLGRFSPTRVNVTAQIHVHCCRSAPLCQGWVSTRQRWSLLNVPLMWAAASQPSHHSNVGLADRSVPQGDGYCRISWWKRSRKCGSDRMECTSRDHAKLGHHGFRGIVQLAVCSWVPITSPPEPKS